MPTIKIRDSRKSAYLGHLRDYKTNITCINFTLTNKCEGWGTKIKHVFDLPPLLQAL